jgi:hypothetical protein
MAYNVQTSNVRKKERNRKKKRLLNIWRSMGDDYIYGDDAG